MERYETDVVVVPLSRRGGPTYPMPEAPRSLVHRHMPPPARRRIETAEGQI